jgi:hypothetical protein
MAIDRVKIRARISIGDLPEINNLIVETGNGYADVMSFNVTKSRRAPSTFSASLKVQVGDIRSNLVGSNVKIEAGEDSANNIVFVGIARSAKISPCFDDPDYVILAISGSDALSFLQGKKYTRRCRATKSAWVSINSVVRKKLKSGKFEIRKQEMFDITDGELPVAGGHVKHKVPTYEKLNVESPKRSEGASRVNLDATYHE